jgi:hypothetical protein
MLQMKTRCEPCNCEPCDKEFLARRSPRNAAAAP